MVRMNDEPHVYREICGLDKETFMKGLSFSVFCAALNCTLQTYLEDAIYWNELAVDNGIVFG